jgi:hypothetical protein
MKASETIDTRMVRGLDGVINLLEKPTMTYWPRFIEYINLKESIRKNIVSISVPELEDYTYVKKT